MTMKTERPGWTERICYAAGGIGIKAAFGVITGYFLMYLTNVAMLDIVICSAIIGVSKVFDGISDVMVGNIIDNTTAKLGNARTWLLRMCLPFAVTEILLFRVPSGFPELLKYVYVFLMYNIVSTLMLTFMQISHYSMVSLISDDRAEQSVLSSIQALTRSIGALLGSVVFVKLLSALTDEPGNQNTQTAYTRSMIVVCGVMVVLTLITVAGTRERVQRPIAAGTKKSLIRETIASLRLLLKSRYWTVLIVCDLMLNIVLQFMATGATYYSLYVLHNMTYMSMILMTTLIPTIAVIIITPVLVGRFGKQKLFTAGLMIAVAGLAGFGITAPSITPMMMFNILYGAGSGLVKGVIVGLIADAVAYTDRTTGQLKAGAGNAAMSATDKLGNGLGSVIFGAAVAAAGFNAALDSQGIAQPQSVNTAISMMFIWVPMLIFAVVFVIFTLSFDLERKMKDEI